MKRIRNLLLALLTVLMLFNGLVASVAASGSVTGTSIQWGVSFSSPWTRFMSSDNGRAILEGMFTTGGMVPEDLARAQHMTRRNYATLINGRGTFHGPVRPANATLRSLAGAQHSLRTGGNHYRTTWLNQ